MTDYIKEIDELFLSIKKLELMEYKCTEKTIFDISLNNELVLTIFKDEKSVRLHGGYISIAYLIPALDNFLKDGSAGVNLQSL